MAKRKRIKADENLLPVGSWAEADELLETMRKLQVRRDFVADDAEERMMRIKFDADDAIREIDREIDLATRSLQAFAAAHRDQIKGKSRKSPFGVIGWRSSTSVRITRRTMSNIQNLSAAVQKRLLRVRYTIDKKALAKEDDAMLAKVEAVRETTETFYAEPVETEYNHADAQGH